MKRLPLFLICLMLLLTACGGAGKRGEAAGHRFLAAWGDTAAMHLTVQQFDALRGDSLMWPWQVKTANRACDHPLVTGIGSAQVSAHDRIVEETRV